MARASLSKVNGVAGHSETSPVANGVNGVGGYREHVRSASSLAGNYTTHDFENLRHVSSFQAKPGYKQWTAQAGTLVADLLTCAGADHIVRTSSLFASECFVDISVASICFFKANFPLDHLVRISRCRRENAFVTLGVLEDPAFFLSFTFRLYNCLI